MYGGRYPSFEAMIGIDDAARVSATAAGAVFTVSVGGKADFKSDPVKPGQKGVKVCVPCKGAKTLRLTVTGTDGVFADWCAARLAR